MWSSVAPSEVDSPAPSARSKHSASLIGEHVYLLGGRNGNLPLKDFWKYNLVTGKWQQIKAGGDKLPCLQEHSTVSFKDNIYVFGGEVGFSAGTETPLWAYDIKANTWRKIKTKKGVVTPKGRRGHTALVHRGSMLIYGGYQDLRGSCSELWAFHFETESWHLLSSSPSKHNTNNTDLYPPPRHKHSAVLHEDSMWIYGGMTDLQERSDLWKWDFNKKLWTNVKAKVNPGPLHSHAVCKLPSSMVVFGGERNGHPTNELWKFNFSLELWEKITILGLKPQPRCESIAFTVSELLLKNPSSNSLETKQVRIRARTCNSADRGSRHSSYLPNNRVAPSETTYVFRPSQGNYTDGSDLAQQYSEQDEMNRPSKSFLQEISKLSISRLNNKCSYTVLTGGCASDSTESLLRQHASPQGPDNEFTPEVGMSTPSRGKLVKSKSAFVIKKKYGVDVTPSPEQETTTIVKKKVEFDCAIKKITREPISVPNFSILTLPTPVLTPVEAAKLVYLDTDDENDLEVHENTSIMEVKCNNHYNNHHHQNQDENEEEEDNQLYENYSNSSVKRGESYSSHLAYADNPLYQHMINTNTTSSVKFQNHFAVPEKFDENISSTSDYASIETVNRLSSASNYSVKTNTPQEENLRNKERDKDGPFGFCNPNYMGPDIKSIITTNEKQQPSRNVINKLITTSMMTTTTTTTNMQAEEEVLELQNLNGVITKNSRVVFRNSRNSNNGPPKSLDLVDLTSRPKFGKSRALSASRAERNNKIDKLEVDEFKFSGNKIDPFVPLYVYIIGGKEQQVTVFKRPISIWKLKLF